MSERPQTDQKCSGCGATEKSCMARPEPCCDLCLISAMFTHEGVES